MSKSLCILAVLLAVAIVADATPRSLTQYKPPDSNAIDNGTPYDAVWICSVYYSGGPTYGDCGSPVALNAYLTLARSIIPAASMSLSSARMMAVSTGCCLQMDILNTTANSTADDQAFAFMANGRNGLNTRATQTGIANWAKRWGVCGPSSVVTFLVGWDIFYPLRVKYFGCNIGTYGVGMSSLCRC